MSAAIDIDALERMAFGHELSGVELVRRGLALFPPDRGRAVLREGNDFARAAIYTAQARSYESDAAILASSEDPVVVHCLGGDHEAAHVYAALAGARWVAALASLLGGRGPYLLSIEDVQRLRELARLERDERTLRARGTEAAVATANWARDRVDELRRRLGAAS